MSRMDRVGFAMLTDAYKNLVVQVPRFQMKCTFDVSVSITECIREISLLYLVGKG